jgi:hypothetical protein
VGLGSFIVIGGCILAAFVATFPALPRSADLVAFDAAEAAASIEVSLQTVRQDATQSDLLFGMETEPEAGAVAEKWRAVKTDIDREQQVLARCRALIACPVVAQNLLDIVAEGTGRSGVARVGLINRAVNLAITSTGDEAQWGVVNAVAWPVPRSLWWDEAPCAVLIEHEFGIDPIVSASWISARRRLSRINHCRA